MKTYSKKEIEELVNTGETGNYHLVIHSEDLVKLAHAIAYNAQNGSPKTLDVLTDTWKEAVNKHLVKVFSTYLKQEKIHIIKSREEDA
jgi:uncharacterized protein YvpB